MASQSSKGKNYTKSEEADIAKTMAANDPNQGKINLMFKSNGRRSKLLSPIKPQSSQSLTPSPPPKVIQVHQPSDAEFSQARSDAKFSTVTSSSRPGDALTAAQARKLFTKSETKADYYNCIFCPTSRKQGKGHGATNLKDHINFCKKKPVDFLARLESGEYDVNVAEDDDNVKGSQAVLPYAGVDPLPFFMSLVIKDGLPFRCVESETLRGLFKKSSVPTRKTLVKRLSTLAARAKDAICRELNKSEAFALVLDDWTWNLKHYCCVIVTFLKDGEYAERLVAFRTLPDPIFADAKEHCLFLLKIINEYDLDCDQLKCIIGDHSSVNKSLAKTYLEVPLLGCYSHRLNLAVQEYIEKRKDVDVILKKVQTLMRWIKNSYKAYACLGLNVGNAKGYRPILSNQTRWTSKFRMTERYLKYVDEGVLNGKILKEFKKRKNHSKSDMVTSEELKTLREVNKVFNNVLWPATTKLQKKGITVSAAARIIATAAKGAPFLEKWWKKL